MPDGDEAEVFFGEGCSSVTLSAAPSKIDQLRAMFEQGGIEFEVIGHVSESPRLVIRNSDTVIDEDILDLMRVHEQAIERRLAANG
jgi:selenophosphate synthetase-related protein